MISVGVVFYNELPAVCDDFLNRLSKAIIRSQHSEKRVFEIIFVLNSNDIELENHLRKFLLSKSDPVLKVATKLIKNSENNIGLARKRIVESALTDWIYFTDPDVQFEEDLFQQFDAELKNIDQEKWLGITGRVVQSSDGPVLKSMFKFLSNLSGLFSFSFQSTSPYRGFKVDHAPTAHLLLNKNVVLQLGNFSEIFSRYGEDLDLTHRATMAQYSIYFGTTNVTHMQNLDFFDLIEKFFNYGRVQAKVFFKNGISRQRLYRITPALGVALIVPIVFLVGPAFSAGVVLLFLILAAAKNHLLLTALVILTYGIGTIIQIFKELYALIARTFFSQKTRQRFQWKRSISHFDICSTGKDGSKMQKNVSR